MCGRNGHGFTGLKARRRGEHDLKQEDPRRQVLAHRAGGGIPEMVPRDGTRIPKRTLSRIAGRSPAERDPNARCGSRPTPAERSSTNVYQA